MNKIVNVKIIGQILLMIGFLMSVNNVSIAQNSDYKFNQAKAYFEAGNYKAALPLIQEVAKAGNAEAQYMAGNIYYFGRDVARDITIAKRMLNLAKNGGNSDAMVLLASIAWDENNEAEAFKLLKTASEKGNILAKYRLGLCYKYGWGTTQDAESAFFLFHELANQDFYPAMLELGKCYADGLGVKANMEEAFNLFTKIWNETKGYSEAGFYVARFYENGYGTSVDKAKAYDCYKEVADNFDDKFAAYAAQCVGRFHQYGIGGAEIDGIEAMVNYRRALEKGVVDPETYINIGALYEDGVGVAQSYEKALEYYQKFADTVGDYGSGLIGDFYYQGKGVPQDYAKAFQYYSNIEKEDAVIKNKLVSWVYGNTAFSLARCYQNGHGTEVNMEKARKFYELAAEYENEDATKALLELEKQDLKKEMIEKQLFTFCELALYYYDESKGNDYAKAFKLFECARDEGETMGLTYVAICYSLGHGVMKDEKEGFKLMLKAAENGEAVAQCLVGQKYFNGEGTSKSIRLAKYWTRKSMESGFETGKKTYLIYSQYVELGDEHLGGIVYRVDETGKHGSVVSKKFFKGGHARCRLWASGYCEGGNCNWRLPSISDYREINSVRSRIKLSVYENSWYWTNEIVGPSSTQGYVFGWQGSRKSNIQQASEYPAVAVSDF